jgi:predicted PurR-regulated permease PerM
LLLQVVRKCPHFFRLRALVAAHAQRHSDHDLANVVFLQDVNQAGKVGLFVLAFQGRKALSGDPKLVSDRHADALCAHIERQHALSFFRAVHNAIIGWGASHLFVDFNVIAGGKERAAAPAAPPVQPNGSRHPEVPLTNLAQRVIAIVALLAALYFGKLVLITLILAVLITFLLEPSVGWLERHRVPRPLGAALGLMALVGLLYLGSYFFYLRAQEFAEQLPQYSHKLRDSVVKFRRQASEIQKTAAAIIPEKPAEKGTVKVQQVDSITSTNRATLTETALALSFVPFLVYFMLTWEQHVRASAVKLFSRENRTTAYVAMSHVAQMLRGFLVGNLVVGLMMSAISAIGFWWFGIPYFYFIGIISGFLSLVPYLGIVLAVLPPLAAGIGVLSSAEIPVVIALVLVIHLFGLNLLYPKVLGARMQLNPLMVTVALLFWGFLWGAPGLLLAIPVTAALKITCDHVPALHSLGELLSEGRLR